MSKKEKKWSRIYLFLMIFFYGVFGPVSILLFFLGEEGFPYTLIVVGTALPFMRKNHLTQIREKEESHI